MVKVMPSRMISTKGTSGTSLGASPTRSRDSRARGPSSCSSSTTATLTRTRPSWSRTFWPTFRKRFSPRILACPKAPSPTSPRRNSTSFNRKCPARSPRIGWSVPGRLVEVEPGGMRELHWHPNSDELQYSIEGQGRMTVYASNTNAQTFDYQGGRRLRADEHAPLYREHGHDEAALSRALAVRSLL